MSSTVEELQQKHEKELEPYKNVIRYWHAVVTLQRPIDYGVWFLLSLTVFIYLGTRDWTVGTTFFLSVFTYFLLGLVIDMVGGIPFAKLINTNYEMSEEDPYKKACKLIAYLEDKTMYVMREMREFRRLNNAKFTFQMCLVSLVFAMLASWVSGFFLCLLVVLAAFVGPVLVVRQLHLVALEKAQPYIEMARQKLGLAGKASGEKKQAASDSKKEK